MVSNVNKKGAASMTRRVKKDVASNRICVFFLILAAVVIAIFSLKKSNLSTEMNFYTYVRPVLIPVFALLTVGAVVLLVLRRRNGRDESLSSFPSSMMLCISAGLTALCLLYPYFNSTRLVVLAVACGALYVIYYLYPYPFFVYSAVTLIGGLCIAFMHMKSNPVLTIVLAVLGLALIGGVLFVLFASTGKAASVLSLRKGEKYPFVITAALVIAGLVIGLVLPAYTFWVLVALFAAYLVIAVIQTLRLI